MNNKIRVHRLTGSAVLEYLPQVAKLRITVFREYPYLYDGDLQYEEKYLKTYSASPGSVIVAAFDGDTVIGAATAVPMPDADEAVRKEFIAAGYNVNDWFYFGESVLLPAYRGQGIGVEFFHHREAHARDLGGFTYITFCGVVRPDDHPHKPADYMPLTIFWQRRGYQPLPNMTCYFSWKEINETEETAKPLSFWYKELKS